MTPSKELITRLRSMRSLGGAHIARVLLTEKYPYIEIIACLRMAFQIPLDQLIRLEFWKGFGPGGTLTDEDVDRIFAPYLTPPKQDDF